ncbi:MAG: hypothetical protein WCK17_01775 [Verrucomicrobiota bacterium]
MRIRPIYFVLFLSFMLSCKRSELSDEDSQRQQVVRDATSEVTASVSAASNSTSPKKESEIPPLPPVNEDKVEKNEFKTAYDASTRKALAEFPELGNANSTLNLAFVARVKTLRERNAEDLKDPNWPYLLATQIARELTTAKVTSQIPSSLSSNKNPPTDDSARQLKNNQSTSKNEAVTTPLKGPEGTVNPPSEDAVWTVQQLAQLATLPKRGTAKGTVTKVQKQIAGDPFDVVLVFDNVLTCEINVGGAMEENKADRPSSYYYTSNIRRSSNLELTQETSSVRLSQKDTATATAVAPYSIYSSHRGSNTSSSQRDILVIKVGDNLSVSGVFIRKPNGKFVLKGQLKD